MSQDFTNSSQDYSQSHCYGEEAYCPAAGVIRPPSLDQKACTSIDASVRFPVLLLFGTALFWLLVGSFLSFLAAIKLTLPWFLDGPAFLTYGRLFPTACDLLVYGWAIPSGLGVILWLTARLCATPFPCTKIITSAAILWNITILLGSLAILCGYGTSVQWLEYPNWASFLLFISFLLISIWVLMFVKSNASRSLYLSQWYFLGALCSFPWLYATANLLLTWGHVQGSAQGPIHWWYGSNLIALWLTLTAIGTAYYFIPKIIGRAIANYYLSLFVFWSLILFTSWNAMTYLVGGPIPAWMMSTSVAASFLMIIPSVGIALNFHQTLSGNYSAIAWSPTLRFAATGLFAYLIFNALSILNAIPSVNAVLHFTDYTNATLLLALLGFFSMIIFGAMYYSIPRLLNLSWPSASLIRRHFWYAFIGISLMVSSMTLGGLIEGLALEDAAISFRNIISYSTPWHWLNIIAWALLLVSYSYFSVLLTSLFWRVKNPTFSASSIKTV